MFVSKQKLEITLVASAESKLEAFLVTKFINRLFVKSHIHTKLNLILSKNLDPLIDLRSFDFVFKEISTPFQIKRQRRTSAALCLHRLVHGEN